MLLDHLRTRIAAEIDELPAERLQYAAELAELVRRDALPNAPLSGFLIAAGARPLGDGESGAGFFIQPVEQRVAVVLILNSASDVTGGKAVPRADVLEKALIKAIAGWMPAAEDDAVYTTDFRFAGSNVASLVAGRVIYQVEFSIELQLRIIP